MFKYMLTLRRSRIIVGELREQGHSCDFLALISSKCSLNNA